jgi:HlyD family secretion protein
MTRLNKRRKIVLAVIAAVALAVILKVFVFKPEFRYAGTLEATEVELSARVPSAISEVTVEEGDAVKKGQLLVRLACEDLRITARLAKENYERIEKLRKTGTATQEQYERALSSHQDAQTRLDWCDVASPIPGTVLTRYHEPGEWVNPGTKLVSLANLQEIWAYIYVPQPLIHLLKPGMEVEGTLGELEDRKFKGRILKINSEAEFTPKNVQTQAERTRLVFGVKIRFENADQALKPGMTIEVPLFEARLE